VRAQYPNYGLAEPYDPLIMSAERQRAHKAEAKAVNAADGYP